MNTKQTNKMNKTDTKTASSPNKISQVRFRVAHLPCINAYHVWGDQCAWLCDVASAQEDGNINAFGESEPTREEETKEERDEHKTNNK